ncbi:MAG: hypothetical protein CSB01_01945 [Bacteroidia bacterium]|nr:MAG: hypothetical protein CSB01_01945 [Bacteroidia bacterium]
MPTKNKFKLEFSINTSSKLIFPRLSTASGLSEWFADDVAVQGKNFIFKWHEHAQTAELLHKKRNESVRFKWLNSKSKDDFFEFKLVKDELTQEIALIVTDFASDEEKVEAIALRESQINDLKRTLGV